MSAGGLVLAGGRSSRMGRPKAALDWHGTTLLARTVGVLARAVGGPVLVVRAPGQALPVLRDDVSVVDDPAEGVGPLLGVATGLAALDGRAEVAFVAATDLPLLHPAFVARVLAACTGGTDLALPHAHGYPQPLAAAYRVALAPLLRSRAAAGRPRLVDLPERVNTRWLDEAALLAEPVLAAADPDLDSVLNVNSADDYEAARRRGPPAVTVHAASGDHRVRAGTLGAAVPGGDSGSARLNGKPAPAGAATPLVTGDVVTVGEGCPAPESRNVI